MTAANREDELSNLTETSLIVFLKHNKTNLGQGYINFTKRMNDQTKKLYPILFGSFLVPYDCHNK